MCSGEGGRAGEAEVEGAGEGEREEGGEGNQRERGLGQCTDGEKKCVGGT